jgi:uncharacterized protein YgiM (DUF1202 family)
LVFWSQQAAHAEEPVEDYLVRTKTTCVDEKKVQMVVIVWDVKRREISAWTVAEGSADGPGNSDLSCPPPDSLQEPCAKALQYAVCKAKEWIEENLSLIRVKVASANIKEAPSLQSRTLATVQRGTTLQQIGKDKEWIKVALKVALNGSQPGWILEDQVERRSKPPRPNSR